VRAGRVVGGRCLVPAYPRYPRYLGYRTLAWLAVVATCTAGCTSDEQIVERTRSPAANVVLVTIDALRADHLGCYGYVRDTSPNIDALAGRGVRFANTFSQGSETVASMASIQTSRYQSGYSSPHGWTPSISPAVETLAEMLREQGFRTAGFTSRLDLAPRTGFAQGFEDYFVFHAGQDDKLVDKARAWLGSHPTEQFFLWIHFFGPHRPFDPPLPWSQAFTDPGYTGHVDGSEDELQAIARRRNLPAADKQHLIALYDGKVKRVDHLFGTLVHELDALELRDRTLVIVSADHGEALFDHSHYVVHQAFPYDGVLRVPLLMSLPGRLPEGLIVEKSVVESIDIVPTVLDLVGVSRPAGVQGLSLLPLATGAAAEPREHAYSAIRGVGGSVVTVRTPEWRYVYYPKRRPNVRSAPGELYAVQDDPRQQENVAGQHPEVVATLQDTLLEWTASIETEQTTRRSRVGGAADVPPVASGRTVVETDFPSEIAELIAELRVADTFEERDVIADELAGAGADGVPTLVSFLKDDDARIRWWVAEALARMGSTAESAIPALAETLKDDANVTVRWRAARALGFIGTPAARPALEHALGDENDDVRQAAAKALARLRPDG
jgi:arylsulfatase A-like enzyme